MLKVHKKCPEGWDEFNLRAGGEANILQSLYWANVIRMLDAAEPFFITFEHQGKTIAQALVLKRYFFNRESRRKIFFLPYLECLDGPVIIDPDHAVSAIEEITEFAVKLGKQCLATHIRFEPPHTSRWISDTGMARVYQNFGFKVNNWATYLVNLRSPENEILEKVDKKAREKIRKASRMGVKIRKINDPEDFILNAGEVFRAGGVKKAHSFSTARVIFEEDKKGFYHYYLAYDKKNRNLAVIGMYVFNNVATSISSSLSPVCRQERIPAQDSLTWNCILEARRMGCHTFDMAGVNPNPQTPKEAGIKQFKEKWGGKYVEYNFYFKDLLPVLSKIRKWIRPLAARIREKLA